ncbi:MAG: hypothetical protein C5B49_15555 [Bdellovibrio sp.]|nr:MAG: hypothetical protein C5B49_15555 [Bdellovibrio sp.]
MTRQYRKRLRLTFGAGIVLVLLAGFQNCAQSVGGMVTDSTPVSALDNKISASQFRELIMNDLNNNRTIDLDIDSGVAVDESNNHRYCLPLSERDALSQILGQAEVCEPIQHASPSQQCSAEYVFPYAQLRSSGLAVNLGEKRDGCESPIDLCGESSTALKSFIIAALSRIETLDCP